MNINKKKTGLVALIGRTNVGKSTLLNQFLEQKLFITSRKPQTTRHRLLGIKTVGENQIIFIDTPGFHQGFKRALNKHMNQLAIHSMNGVDVILFIVESLRLKEEDENLLKQIPKDTKNVILVINKIDKLKNKNHLLPFMESLIAKFGFEEIVPISALKKLNIKELEQTIISKLPKGEHLYPKERVALFNERFLVAEIIREKCISRLGEEIPYRLAVVIDKFIEQEKITHIDATLYVEKSSQKGIVVGQKGRKLKAIGIVARKDLEDILQVKVMLKLWVKVRKGWTDNVDALSALGYEIG